MQAEQSPLHVGAICGSVSASRVLLQASAEVDVQDSEGYTPLMNACQEGDLAMVTLLLEYNADTQMKDEKGSFHDLSISAPIINIRLY